MGTLFIVATPIGNLGDITLRAIETLGSVDAILCEDTRKTGILLKNISEKVSEFKNRPKMVSYYEQNEAQRIPEVVTALQNGLNIALVSDAGTPLISDPGFKLVRECLKEGIKVESIPGASSVISSLVSSGLPTDKFLFVGYPSKKEGKREKFFIELRNLLVQSNQIEPTVVMLESPHRLIETLTSLQTVFGDITIVLARELTKIHEEIKTFLISEALEHFSKHEPKGEFVLLFNLKDYEGRKS